MIPAFPVSLIVGRFESIFLTESITLASFSPFKFSENLKKMPELRTQFLRANFYPTALIEVLAFQLRLDENRRAVS